MEYKSIDKYLRKNGKKSYKDVFVKLGKKVLVCVVILLIGLIYLKYDKNNGNKIYNYLYSKNITMASINELYKKYFKDILPFDSIGRDDTQSVFNETISYKDISKYKDGSMLLVEDNYLVPVLESGIVVFIGNKEEYGNTLIIEQVDGVRVWYSNVENINVNIYDYVKKGEYLASVSGNKLYLVLEKDGAYISYKDYVNEN